MTTLEIIEQIAGALLMALVLLDVFFTVVYARVGTGIISTRVARGTWLVVRALAYFQEPLHLEDPGQLVERCVR
jgi:hypothetical protein